MSFRSKIFVLVTLLLCTIACGDIESSNPTTQTGCDTRTDSRSALIGLYDNFAQHLCGCSEAQGTTTLSSQSFTCTVSSGTTVVFQSFSLNSRHQIRSSDSTEALASPLFDSKAESARPTYGVKLSNSGTYSFQDVFNSSISGQIIVQ